MNALQHKVSLGIVELLLACIVKGIAKQKGQIAQPAIGFAVVHQVLDLVIGLGPGETIAILGLHDDPANRVKLVGERFHIRLSIRVAGTEVGPSYRKESSCIRIGGIGVVQ